ACGVYRSGGGTPHFGKAAPRRLSRRHHSSSTATLPLSAAVPQRSTMDDRSAQSVVRFLLVSRRNCWYTANMKAATENMIGRVLEPVFRTLPPDAARQIVGLTADEELQQKVQSLAQRANEGELTPEQREEYEALIDAGDILATLQALARRTLQQTIR
ncbi:MAG: hypothetical protein KDA89_03435, partial [Planctomycetaceae bacterium]|nr:hypothetical protein [Planctomycetaceae bacterium]